MADTGIVQPTQCARTSPPLLTPGNNWITTGTVRSHSITHWYVTMSQVPAPSFCESTSPHLEEDVSHSRNTEEFPESVPNSLLILLADEVRPLCGASRGTQRVRLLKKRWKPRATCQHKTARRPGLFLVAIVPRGILLFGPLCNHSNKAPCRNGPPFLQSSSLYPYPLPSLSATHARAAHLLRWPRLAAGPVFLRVFVFQAMLQRHIP